MNHELIPVVTTAIGDASVNAVIHVECAQRIQDLETILRQILRDAIAQDVLFDWWSPIADTLKIPDGSAS